MSPKCDISIMLKPVATKGTEQCHLEGAQQQGLEGGSCGGQPGGKR